MLALEPSEPAVGFQTGIKPVVDSRFQFSSFIPDKALTVSHIWQ